MIDWDRLRRDVQVDVFTGGDTTVRATHLPTGHVAEAREPEDGWTQFGLRQLALERLAVKLHHARAQLPAAT